MITTPNSTKSELYTTALTSPSSPNKSSKPDAKSPIGITLSSTPNSSSKPVLRPQESPKKGTLARAESRTKKRKSFYELSPDISDKHVQMLEKNYGGKEKANHAATVIQQHYRSWAMKRAYIRLRTQSEARRTSVKGRLSKRSSIRSPSSSGSLSPTGPLPINLNVTVNESETSNELMLKMQEADVKQKLNSSKEEFKAIQADINIDSNFRQVDMVSKGPGDLSVRRVSEDISSIEISKNLFNDSIGQKMIINEVFQQILLPRKDSISRSDSLKLKRDESIVKESVAVSETVAQLEGVPEHTEVNAVRDGVEGTNCVEEVHGAEQVDKVNGTEGENVNDCEIKINVEKEQVVMMMDERPAEDGIMNSTHSLSMQEERGMLGYI